MIRTIKLSLLFLMLCSAQLTFAQKHHRRSKHSKHHRHQKHHSSRKHRTSYKHETSNKPMETLINLKVGENKYLSFHSLMTAGYIWDYSAEQNDVVSVEKNPTSEQKKTVENGKVIVGVSPDEVFHVKAEKAGQITLTFKQSRNWETDKAPASVKQFKIVVQ